MPEGIVPGHIYIDARFYRDERGKWLPKYLLVLAIAPGGDVVFRLLTSRQHARPVSPPCFHGDPYPGFYLGTPGGSLDSPTWLDLRKGDDYEEAVFLEKLRTGAISRVLVVPRELFCSTLACAAGAEDTTRQQASAMRQQRILSGCQK